MKASATYTLNGEQKNCSGHACLSDLLIELSMTPGSLVVEVNRRIIAKEDYGKIVIQPGDQIEIIHFVGGG